MLQVKPCKFLQSPKNSFKNKIKVALKKDLTCLNCLKAPLIFNVSAAMEANSSLLEILEYRLGVRCTDTPLPPEGTANCWQHIVQLVGLKPDQLVHLVHLISF